MDPPTSTRPRVPPPSTLSGPTSRLASSVSTRSMARLASSSTSSSLTRPTLSSSRKASGTLKRSGALTVQTGAARKQQRAVLGETSLNPTSIRVPTGSPGVKMVQQEYRVGAKRKSAEEGGPTKKVRLHSPLSHRTIKAEMPHHRAPSKYPTTPLRVGAAHLTPRKTPFATTPKSSKAWVHPLAHTPNRVHDSPDEGHSFSSDELMLGDSPVPRAGPEDTPMKTVEEYRRMMYGGRKVKDEIGAPEGHMLASKGEERMVSGGGSMDEAMDDGAEMTEEMSSDEAVFSTNTPFAPGNGVRTSTSISTTTPSQPVFSFSTSPSHSPPRPAITHRTPENARQPKAEPLPVVQQSYGLAPPATPYTIAASPRKGLSSISRFGTSHKQGAAMQTRLPFLPISTPHATVPLFEVEQAASPLLTMSSRAAAPAMTTNLSPPAAQEEDTAMEVPAATSTAVVGPPAGNMLPPSRIPVRSKPAAPNPTASTASSSLKRSALGDLGVAARRPLSQPASTAIQSESSEVVDHAIPVRRKPSYPSSLGSGSGPLARPRDRQISVPVPSHIIEPIHRDVPTLSSTSSGLGLGLGVPSGGAGGSMRSVSAPGPRDHVKAAAVTERQSLSLSTRREGWMDTSKSLHGLSEALERLKVKKEVLVEPTKRPSLSASSARMSLAMTLGDEKENTVPPSTTARASLGMSTSTSSRLSAVHRPRHSVYGSLSAGVSGATVQPGSEAGDISMTTDAGDKSLAAIVCSAGGSACLKGVVAFVDVWTADGSDSSGIFSDMLRSLGARVLSRPTDSCTHIIYKSGRPSTLSWYRKQEEPRPHIVGLSWVTRSKEAGKRLDEGKYRVDIGDEDVFSKRRKSMEPKSLCLAALSSSVGPGREASASMLRSGLAEVKRKSMMHAPKVGSPLKKGYRRGSDDDDF